MFGGLSRYSASYEGPEFRLTIVEVWILFTTNTKSMSTFTLNKNRYRKLAKNELISAFERGDLGVWQSKPLERDRFMVTEEELEEEEDHNAGC